MHRRQVLASRGRLVRAASKMSDRQRGQRGRSTGGSLDPGGHLGAGEGHLAPCHGDVRPSVSFLSFLRSEFVFSRDRLSERHRPDFRPLVDEQEEVGGLALAASRVLSLLLLRLRLVA